jgi:Regulator of ribonuclease activity B
MRTTACIEMGKPIRVVAEIGDICEIETPAGLAYVQYTHEGGGMGQLVRVLPGLFHSRPQDFSNVAGQTELYFIFYTLNLSLRDKQCVIVSHQAVPSWAQEYPLMRWLAARDSSGRPIGWKIMRANTPLTIETHLTTPIVLQLTPEQEKLSVHVLRPHPSMVKELARGWTPQRAEEMRLRDVVEAETTGKGRGSEVSPSDKGTRHFLYFPKKLNAEKASKELRSSGFSVEVRRAATGKEWLVLATVTQTQSGAQLANPRDELEALAARLGGEYDGLELAV